MRKVADSVMFLYGGEAIYFGPVSELDKSDNRHVKNFLAMDRVEIHGKIEDN
jgi:ABC-type transporter Mla maintaining outer membrane lipid asymmetry ATPase subunit MlaF